jgi:hypothetical protein
MMTRAELIATAVEGCAKIQAATQWLDNNQLTGEYVALRTQLCDLAWRFEMMMNVEPGTFTNALKAADMNAAEQPEQQQDHE